MRNLSMPNSRPVFKHSNARPHAADSHSGLPAQPQAQERFLGRDVATRTFDRGRVARSGEKKDAPQSVAWDQRPGIIKFV
jgi:hypothetical protein